MKVSLSSVNRLSILGLLGDKGNITMIKSLRELREDLSFTDDENVLLNFRQLPNGRTTFNDKLVPPKEFIFEGVREIILDEVKTKLREMESKGELLLDHLSLYEVLIENLPQEE